MASTRQASSIQADGLLGGNRHAHVHASLRAPTRHRYRRGLHIHAKDTYTARLKPKRLRTEQAGAKSLHTRPAAAAAARQDTPRSQT